VAQVGRRERAQTCWRAERSEGKRRVESSWSRHKGGRRVSVCICSTGGKEWGIDTHLQYFLQGEKSARGHQGRGLLPRVRGRGEEAKEGGEEGGPVPRVLPPGELGNHLHQEAEQAVRQSFSGRLEECIKQGGLEGSDSK